MGFANRAGGRAGPPAGRDFRVVLGGQAVSALGDAISITAMPLLVLVLTGSGALMGVVGALQLVPDLLLGLPAGALADRWDRRRMMQRADAGRAVLTLAIPVVHWLDGPTMAAILLLAVPINVLRLVSDAGFTSAVPSLVGRENLARASSTMEATLSVPYIVGPAAAGVLVVAIGPASVLAIDAPRSRSRRSRCRSCDAGCGPSAGTATAGAAGRASGPTSPRACASCWATPGCGP
ncbi:MAG: MFS transporter [Acidimicrobiia bacterium]|nr:MFS transporter [Acidimicrobiia bacterium]